MAGLLFPIYVKQGPVQATESDLASTAHRRLTIPLVSQPSAKLVSADTSRCLPAESPWPALLCQAAVVVCCVDGAMKIGSCALHRR